MKTNFTLRVGLLLTFALSFSVQGNAQNFTTGNIVVSRAGDGSTALSTNLTGISLLEYTKTGENQSAPVTTTTINGIGASTKTTIAGTITSNNLEGQLNLSSNSQFLSLVGYDAAIGSASTNRAITGIAAPSAGSGGSGYTTSPTVTISAPDLPGGIQATAGAQVSGGAVTNFYMINTGSGYSLPATVTISAPTAGTQATAGAITYAAFWLGFDKMKVIARINGARTVDVSTVFPSSSTAVNNAYKSLASVDGTSFYINGPRLEYATFGQTTASTSIFSVSSRGLGIFNNNVYFSTSFVTTTPSTTIRFTNPPLPTAAATVTGIPGITTNTSPSNFVFFDVDPLISYNGTGADLLYMGNLFNGLDKFYFDGTNWVLAGSYGAAGTSFSAITAAIENSKPVIYAVTSAGTSNNTVVAITDGDSRTSAFTVLTTHKVLASSGANYSFRGVAFTPTGGLGIKANELDSKIQLWPNPAHNEFNILNALNQNDGASSIEISNVNGQVVHTQKSNPGTTTTIQTNGWAAGVYILKATNNGVQTTKKLIVQ